MKTHSVVHAPPANTPRHASPRPKDRGALAQSNASAATAAPARSDHALEATYWRLMYMEERERLAKLWVAYQDVLAEIGRRKVGSPTLAVGERARVNEPGMSGPMPPPPVPMSAAMPAGGSTSVATRAPALASPANAKSIVADWTPPASAEGGIARAKSSDFEWVPPRAAKARPSTQEDEDTLA